MPATVAIVSKCRGLDRKGCAHYPSPPTPAVLIIHFNWACIDWCDQLSCMQALSFWDSYLTKSGSAINPCHWGPPNFDLIMVGSKYSDLERFRIKENMALISIWKFLLWQSVPMWLACVLRVCCFFAGAHVCVLAFSCVDRESFLALESWKKKVPYKNLNFWFMCEGNVVTNTNTIFSYC